jgi:hypothetical protein
MTTQALTPLTEKFAQVEATYSHYPKWVQPASALITPQVFLKWYLIYPESLPITAEQIAEAQTCLREGLSAGRLALSNEVGFVVQHRCAEVLILYVCTWRGNNEVWETLYHKPITPNNWDPPYAMHERENTSGTFCVWVLPAVLHEQKAWVRYLQSPRDEAAQQAYIGDQLTGVV